MWLCWDHNALHYPADLNQQVAHFGHDPSSVFNALIWAQGEHCTGEITVLTQTLRILLISSGNYSQVWWGRWTSQTCKLGQRDCENMGKITQTRFCFNNFQKKILNRNRTYSLLNAHRTLWSRILFPSLHVHLDNDKQSDWLSLI